MNETIDPPDGAAVSAIAGLPRDADVLPALAPEVADRSMLVVQYAIAVIAAICAILLSRAS